MVDQVELNIDLKSGVIEIKANAAAVSTILDRVESLLQKFWNAKPILPTLASQDDNAQGIDAKATTQSNKAEESAKKSNGRGTSKRVNWNISDLGFPAPVRQEIRDSFEKLNAKTQNEQVAAVATLLSARLGVKELDGNQIASGLRLAGVKIPANLLAVFGNMKTLHITDVKDGKLIVTGYLEDFITDMTKNNAKAQKK
jgi:hypothetical protein